MAYTAADAEMLKKLIDSITDGIGPEESAKFSNGSSVVYRSADDLLKLLYKVQSWLDQANGVRRPKVFKATVSKGVF